MWEQGDVSDNEDLEARACVWPPGHVGLDTVELGADGGDVWTRETRPECWQVCARGMYVLI